MKITALKQLSVKFSKRFYKYFFSYIFLLLVVLLSLGAVVYGSFINTLKQDVEASNISELEQIRNMMNIRLKEMEKIAVNISIDSELKPYIVSSVGVDSLSIIKQLYKYKTGNNFLFDIALYHKYKENQKIYTTETVDNLDMFFNYLYKFSNFNKNDFLSLTEKIEQPTMLPSQQISVNTSLNKRFATFIYPLPMNSSEPHSFVLFFIEEDSLKDMIRNILDNYEGYVYILDEKNNPVVYLGQSEEQMDPSELLGYIKPKNIKDSITDVKVDRMNFSVTEVKSDYNRWSYITAIPTDQFMDKVYNRKMIFYNTIVIILIIGGFVAFVLALGNYWPLRKLADGLATTDGNYCNGKKDDEYSIIANVFNEVSEKNKYLIDRLGSQAQIVKEKFIEQILKSKNMDYQLINQNKFDDEIKFENPKFLVAIFIFDSNRSSGEQALNNKSRKLNSELLKIIEDASRAIGKGYSIDLIDDSGIALLLNLKEEWCSRSALEQYAIGIKETVKEKYSISLTVCFGKSYERLDMVHQSYIESKRASDYRFIRGTDSIIFFEDVNQLNDYNQKYLIEQENELIVNLRLGNKDMIESALNKIKSYICTAVISPELMQYIYFGLIKSITKTMEDINIDLNDLGLPKDRLFNKNFESVDVLFENLKFICFQVCFICNGQKESKNFELRDKIINIAKENYKDPTITLNNIASACGMSPSYISRFFKDHTGYPPMQYIDMLRMETVKQFLKSSDLPLRDILDQVGYIDESNFIRKFKKNEGITPMQYRSIIKRN